MWYIIFTLTQQICRLSLLDFTDHLGMTLGLLRQFSMVVASFRAQSMEDWLIFRLDASIFSPTCTWSAYARVDSSGDAFRLKCFSWGVFLFGVIDLRIYSTYIYSRAEIQMFLLKSRKNSPVTEQVSNSIRFLDTLIFISLERFSISVTEETLRCSIG